MLRVLRHTGVAIQMTVLVDNVATDPSPDSATVTITREDGTVIVTNAAATNTGVGIFSYNLTPTHTAVLDELTAVWTYTRAGNVERQETHHEVVGGFICLLPQIDAQLNRGGTASSYATAAKQDARDVAAAEFERDCGVAFAPRYGREKFDGEGGADMAFSVPRVTAITSASVGGTALTAGELADLELYRTGKLYNPLSWASGRQNVEIKYEHGWPFPPPDISNAAAIAAAHALKDGPFDDRGYGVTDEGGAVRLLTQGVQGAMSSIPTVQAALARHQYEVIA